MPSSTEPRIGSELLGFRVERLLGRGGMGVVYLAQQLALDRLVALKLLAPELALDEAYRDRFLRESKLAAALDHPNIVPVFDAGEVDGRLYIAMRYVEGSDLKQLLTTNGPLSAEQTIRLLAPIADALDTAHAKGLVHRDVKPSNILIDQAGRPYLADFGLTKQASERGTIEQSHFAASLDYVAPEQIERQPVGPPADIYSLGCVLHQCLTGQPPYRRDTQLATLWAHLNDPPPKPTETNPELPAQIDAVIARALAKQPEDRQASCRELIGTAREALGLDEPVVARDRRPLILAVIGVAIAAAATVAGVLLSQGGGPGRPSTKPTITPRVDSLQRIDPKTNGLVATIGGVGANPSAIAVGGGSVWVGSQDDGTVSRVDPKTNEVRNAINTGAPDAIVIRDGSVLVANQFGSLTSIDPARLSVSTSSQPGFGYGSFALGEGALWGLWGWNVDRINHGGQVVKTLTDLGLDPFALAAGQGAVWVLDSASRSVVRVDPATNRVVGRLRLRFDPGGIAVGGGSVWVTNSSGGSVVRIDPRSDRIVGATRVGRDPVGIVAGGGSIWVANYEDGTLSRIDSQTGSVAARIRVGRYPATLATGEGGVWVAVRAA